MVTCRICKLKFKRITNTHLKNHKITLDEYKTRYPKAPIISVLLSRQIGRKISASKTGIPRPDVVKRQKENNVMLNKRTRRKASKTRRKIMDEGKIRPLDYLKIEGPTDSEKKAIEIIEELQLPLKFVGDGKFYVGRKCPDFVNKNMKIAIELTQRRYDFLTESKYYLKYGWRLFHILTTDIDQWQLLIPLFKEPRWAKIKKIEKEIHKKKNVYNFECKPNNNYFANGILVHNCFAYMFKTNNASFSEKLHAVNADDMIQTLRKEPRTARQKSLFKHFYEKKFLLHWGGLADPFCNFEKSNNVGYRIIKELAVQNYPTLFSFKGSGIFRPKFRKLFEKYAPQKNFAFQVSIVTGDDKMGRDIEVGVPVPSVRLKAIKMLSDMGYYTVLRLRPFIIGITDIGLGDLLDKALEAGIQAISMEFFALDQRSNEALLKRYNWIAKLIGTKDILKYFKTLSPSERGGYMRLNRLVKERFVKQVYKFCVDNDLVYACSDPDFKELNMSGSCCGMPDTYKDNPELQNWTKNQLTYHLKEARKRYHKKGTITRFHFNEVFNFKEDTYLTSVQLGQDHIGVSDKTASERRHATYSVFARNNWNNLRSPGNPRNYFHGKLMPINIDEQGNLVYKYVPSEYEERWKEEGIDLTI